MTRGKHSLSCRFFVTGKWQEEIIDYVNVWRFCFVFLTVNILLLNRYVPLYLLWAYLHVPLYLLWAYLLFMFGKITRFFFFPKEEERTKHINYTLFMAIALEHNNSVAHFSIQMFFFLNHTWLLCRQCLGKHTTAMSKFSMPVTNEAERPQEEW